MNGVQRIAAERQRKIEDEGFGPEHDSGNLHGEMIRAAICYAMNADPWDYDYPATEDLWPWTPEWWKPGDPIRHLEKAGALLAAEIDRLLRAQGLEGVVYHNKDDGLIYRLRNAILYAASGEESDLPEQAADMIASLFNQADRAIAGWDKSQERHIAAIDRADSLQAENLRLREALKVSADRLDQMTGNPEWAAPARAALSR